MKKRTVHKLLFPSLAGNEMHALLILIICISCKSNQPLNALIYALSGDGKSHLVKEVFKVIPDEWIIHFSSITSAGLTRLPEDYLKNKIVYIDENHAKDNELLFILRLLKSEGKFKRAFTGKDGETEFRTIKGPISAIQTTSSDLSKFQEDDKSRDIVFTVESGKKQKEKILNLNARSAQGKKKESTTKYQKMFKEYLRRFPYMDVIIPYADLIIPKISSNRAPRIQKQAHEIIRTIAMLNYPYKQEAFHSPQKITIEATHEDYRHAYELFGIAFEAQINAKSSLLMYFRHIQEGLHRENRIIFTRGNIQDWTNLKPTSAKNKIKELLEFGLISIHTTHRSNQPAKYILNEDNEINETPFIHPDELWSLVVNRRRDQQETNNINILECGHRSRKGKKHDTF